MDTMSSYSHFDTVGCSSERPLLCRHVLPHLQSRRTNLRFVLGSNVFFGSTPSRFGSMVRADHVLDILGGKALAGSSLSS